VRIVAGKHRGRRIDAPDGWDVRPTSDRVRESLFSILCQGAATLPEDTRVLDVFAGSGALGLEALSRGADFATFMDKDPRSVEQISENVSDLKEVPRARVLRQDATRPGHGGAPCNLVFLDPPYKQGLAPIALETLAADGWIAEGAQVVVELSKKESFEVPDDFTVDQERTYGNTRIVILAADG
jgi:16S rRNA (guanine966-N2)-methyltransferase